MTAMSPLHCSHLVTSILKTRAKHFAPTIVLYGIVIGTVFLEGEAFFDVGLKGYVLAVWRVWPPFTNDSRNMD